jgi:2'-5' RNA ligase
MTDAEFKNTAVIVMPVLWPSTHPQPAKKDLHVTLAFLGDIDENQLVKEDVLDAMAAVDYNVYIFADVYEFDLFGPDSDIPVLKVRHELLQQTYDQLTGELAARGIPWSQNYDFTPHVTIDDHTAIDGWPDTLVLKPVELWWKTLKIAMP